MKKKTVPVLVLVPRARDMYTYCMIMYTLSRDRAICMYYMYCTILGLSAYHIVPVHHAAAWHERMNGAICVNFNIRPLVTELPAHDSNRFPVRVTV